jgi:hypothetical protein
MEVSEKIALVEEIGPVVVAVGLLWDWEHDRIEDSNNIVVWHSRWPKENSSVWVSLKDIKSGKANPIEILEDIIIELRSDASQASLVGW